MLLLLTALTAACGSGGHHVTTAARAGFAARVTNPWFPLRRGSTYRYRGVKDGEPSREVMRVTRRTRTIDGAPTVAVSDLLYLRGRLEERTTDYYTQDADGNVWYFGEDTAELDVHGKVTSREGTWHAGVDGARAGIFMPADPRVGEHHRQEYYRGHAEDQFRVVSLHASVTVPYGTFGGALETHEWTRLEPGVLDAKDYVRGVGEVFEGSVRGPREVFRLVSVRRA
jgi:hypothetical protein